MKTTFKFIIAAMVASAVLTSCQKEMAIDNNANSNDGVRVISASFSAPTKSTLDNKTPKFVGGEKIKVSNTESSEDCTISVTGGVATFSTTLTGTLTAVYPSTAAKMNGNVIDETGVLVSTEQAGTFASANIAMATSITTSATFTNKTAIIKITPGAGSNTKYVEVITAGPKIANDAPTGSAFSKYNKIHVNVNSATTYPVYVSILVPSGLKVKNLSFADGKYIKTAKDNATDIEVNTINEVSSSNWNEQYVEINGLKWATRNVGTTSDDQCGSYFMWGETVGRNPVDDNTFVFPDTKYYTAENSSWDKNAGFAFENCPYTNGKYISGTTENVFTKYTTNNKYAKTGKADAKTTLDLVDDAANVNWGGSWRTPTGGSNTGDFFALLQACGINSYKCTPTSDGSTTTEKGVYWCEDYAGKKGVLFIAENNGDPLFFPAAKQGVGLELQSDRGYYWSNTVTTTNLKAWYIQIGNGTDNVSIGGNNRCFGWSVRPVSD